MESRTSHANRAVVADLALLGVALIWGSTFVIVKDALASVRPFAFLAVRFSLAAAVLLPFARRGLSRGGRRQIGAGIGIGVFLFLGYAAQTIGLQWTSAGKTGFITGLSVVFVPVFAALVLRQPPRADSWLGVGLATTGLALLTLRGSLALGGGDLWVMACAVSFALHIIAVGRHNQDRSYDSVTLAALQIATAAVLSTAASLACERGYWRDVGGLAGIPAAAWPAIVLTAVFATAGAFLVQNLAQRYTSPTRTALVLAMEPVFAALFAWLLAGEVLGWQGLAGGALIVLGMLASELEPLQRLGRRRSMSGGGGHQPTP